MNLRHLAQAIQYDYYFEERAKVKAEMKAIDDVTIAAARSQARADAEAERDRLILAGRVVESSTWNEERIRMLEQRAENAAPKSSIKRDIDALVPTRAWCERIAKKHAKAARAEGGSDQKAIRSKLLEKVRADPDTTGKKKEKP